MKMQNQCSAQTRLCTTLQSVLLPTHMGYAKLPLFVSERV